MKQFKSVAALRVKRGEEKDELGRTRPVFETIPAGRVLGAKDLDSADVERFRKAGHIREVTAEEAEHLKEAEVQAEQAAKGRDLELDREQLAREHAEQRRAIAAKHEAAMREELAELAEEQAEEMADLVTGKPKAERAEKRAAKKSGTTGKGR